MSLTKLAVRVSEPAAEGEHLRLEIEPMAAPVIGPDQCLIEVSAAGVNAPPGSMRATSRPPAVRCRSPSGHARRDATTQGSPAKDRAS